MVGKCSRCGGDGYIVIIWKARSIGISTLAREQMGDRMKCPDCNGTGKRI